MECTRYLIESSIFVKSLKFLNKKAEHKDKKFHMNKLYKLLFCLLISVKSIACDDSSFSLISQTDNGDGTYTYEIELLLDFIS